MTTPERFWSKVCRAGACLIWTAGTGKDGYGLFWNGKKTVRAHRWAWEQEHGPIPPDHDLDHFRMNPGPRHARCSKVCVNLDHLEQVGHGEHVLRGDTLAAREAARTHCVHGHTLADCYTYVKGRYCRTCTHNRNRARLERARRNS